VNSNIPVLVLVKNGLFWPGTSFLKFKAGEPDEASDAKRACTENEDNKWFFLIQFQPLLKPI
jgi:hypothetical protein